MYFDFLYILLIIPPFFISLAAQIFVKFVYKKYLKVPNSANMNGIDMVEHAIKEKRLDIRLNVSPFDLEDHFDPHTATINLSNNVARAPSIASVAIAAHELGHAIQYKESFFLTSVRTFILPMVNIGTTVSYFLFILGISLQIFGLVILGIMAFALSTFFLLITLPIEINASANGLDLIKSTNEFTSGEMSGMKKVLTAAALTYLAALIQSVASLSYYILRAFGVKKD